MAGGTSAASGAFKAFTELLPTACRTEMETSRHASHGRQIAGPIRPGSAPGHYGAVTAGLMIEQNTTTRYPLGTGGASMVTVIRGSFVSYCPLRQCHLGGDLSEGEKRDSKGDMPTGFPTVASSTHGIGGGRSRRGRGYFAPEPASGTRPGRS
jgi:hypothetical protein